MKKNFTLLVFLVVTVNAAAQYKGYLNVGDQTSVEEYFSQDATTSGGRGVIENDRLNVCGYIFPSYKGSWKWIDFKLNIQKGSANSYDGWAETGIFKGPNYYFPSNENIYSAYNTSTDVSYGFKSVIFYITNCSGIDVFLYHKTTNSVDFTITATPKDNNSNNFTGASLISSETLSAQGAYFPSLYGLDKNKIYKIELSIPALTFFHEISFLIRDFRKHDITIGNSNWATMYLDFPVRIPKTEHQNLDVFTIDAIDNDNRVVTGNVYDYIPANTGVLLHEDVTNHETITFIETGKPLDGIGSNWLKGTTIDLSKADNYGLQEDEYALTLGYNQGNLGFFVYKGETIGANKAFLVTSDFENFSKGFYISDFEEFTDIQTVESECTETGNWYSLQGVRLNARPTQRGIYLNNGKKVFVK